MYWDCVAKLCFILRYRLIRNVNVLDVSEKHISQRSSQCRTGKICIIFEFYKIHRFIKITDFNVGYFYYNT